MTLMLMSMSMLAGHFLMLSGRLLIKYRGVALLDGQCALRTDGQACPQAVGKAVAHHTSFSVFQLDGTLSAGCDAIAAAVAKRLVDLNDLSHAL